MSSWDFISNPSQPPKLPRKNQVLTREIAHQIKVMLKDGIPRKKIYDELKHLGVKPCNIADIAGGHSWRNA